MKKETTGKKSLAWLWITIAIVAVLAIAGVVSYFLFFKGDNGGQGSEQNGPAANKVVESDLYWNIDRKEMLEVTSGLSMREPAEDGLYWIRFAVGGEVVELPCADKKLVNRIDMEDLVCLEFDADGLIINMIDPEELYTKIAEKVYVQNISGNKLLVNTSQALNGMQINLEVPTNEGFDVSALAATPGEIRVLEGMDQVTIYGKDEETPTHIFVVDRWWESDVYWRVSSQMYSGGMSTRKQAEDGYWYMDWTVKGEIVTLRTNRNDVINAWDGYNVTKACCGMVFDENGDVIDCFSAAWAVRGTHKAEQWDVVELSEDKKTFTAERILFGNDVGKTFTGTIGEDCGVYNVSSTADKIGEVTELQLNDRLQVYCDSMGNPKVIYVMNRMVDSPLYYNLNRQYSDGLGKSTRTPDADGWYNFELLADGKTVTYRTKDAELANKLDSYSMSLFGLKVSGGVIQKVYDAVCVTGNYSWVSGYYVSDLQGTVITAISGTTSKSGVMSSDCGIYDVSGHSTPKGQKATLRVGDRITAYQNALGEVTHIYIQDRYQAGTSIYYNVARKALKNGETQRTPDADGYYVFDVIKLGSTTVTQIKTKDAKVAADVDRQGTPFLFAGRVNKEGIITAAYAPQAAIEGGARRILPGVHVERQISEDENTWHCCVRSTGATGTLKVTDNTKIYNISAVFDKARGEQTTLRVEDQLYAYSASNGETVLVVLISREAPGAKVFHKYSVPSTPDEDGYYNMILATGGKVGEYKTKSKEARDYIASQTLAVAAFEKNGIISSAFTFSASTSLHGGSAGSYYDVTKIVGNKVYLTRNRPGQTDTGKTAEIELASNCKIYNISTNKTLEEGWGKADKLQVGDRVQGYTNKDGKVVLLTIVLENLRNDNGYAKCPHCGETVWWERLDSNSGAIACDAHFYVAKDFSTNSAYNFGKAPADGEDSDYHFVLDLNGKTITRSATVSQAKDKETGEPLVDEVTGEPIMNRAGSTGFIYVNYGNFIMDDFSKGKTSKMISDPDGITFSGSYTAFGVGANATMVVKYANVDYSTAASSYTTANGGVIAVGGKLTIDGGKFIGMSEHKGSGSIIGTWGDSELIINGGTFVGGTATRGGLFATNGKVVINGGDFSGGNATTGGGGILYASGASNDVYIKGGKFHDSKAYTGSGGFIYSAANLYITGGEFVGVGSNADLLSRSGGIIYAQGMNFVIDNVTLKNGNGNGYGMNIYYLNNNGGTFAIGKNAKIYGNMVVRCGGRKVDGEPVIEPVKLVIQEGALIDHTGSNPDGNINLRVQNVDLYINDLESEPIKLGVVTTLDESNTNYSLQYSCTGKLVGVQLGTTNEAAHNYGDDRVCDDCGYDLDAFQEWTNPNALPEKDGNYKLMVDVEVTKEYGGINATIDLNGHNITRKVAASGASTIWSTGDKTLTIIDSTAGMPGTISAEFAAGATHTSSGGVLFTVNENGCLHVKAGILDGSKVDVSYGSTNMGTIVSGGQLILEGNRTEVYGVKSTAGNGGAIGGWSNTGSTITIKDGAFVYGSQGCGKNGAVLATTGEGVFLDGANIYEGVAADGTNGILISAAKTVLVIKDSYLNGGLNITNCTSATFIGDVFINKGAAFGLKSSKAIDMNGLTDGSQIYVENLGTLSTAFTDATAAQALIDAGCFINGNENYKFKLVGSAINMVDETPAPEKPEVPTVDTDAIVWEDWTAEDSLPTSGSYRLTKNVVLSGTVSATGDLYLDLNGFNISYNIPSSKNDGYAFYVSERYTLYVTDLSGKDVPGKISVTHDAETMSGLTSVVYISREGIFIMDNGIVDGSAIKSAYSTAKTGAVTVGNGKIGGVDVYGTFVMNGGTILGQRNMSGSSGKAGSAIGGMGKTNIIINGGTVKGAESAGGTDYIVLAGGAIATGGNLTVNGGEIIGTRVQNHAGTIWVEGATSKFVMTGGIVRDGYAGANGGNILINNAIAEITGGRIINGRNGGAWGYNIDFASGTNAGWNIVGGDVIIEGGMSIRSGNVVIRDKAIIDGMLSAYKSYSIKMNTGAKIYAGEDLTTPAYTAEAAVKVAPKYDEEGNIFGVTSNSAAVDWTDATSLPTTGWYTLQTDVTVSGVTYFGMNLGIDLNGHTITRVMPAGSTGDTTIFSRTNDKNDASKQGNYLTLVDHSNSDTKGAVKVVYEDPADVKSGTIYSGIIYANQGAGVNLKNVVIDGSNITNTFASNNGVLMIGNDSKLYVNNAHIKGYKSTAAAGSAIASWGGNVIVIDGDKTIIEGSVAAGKHGGVIQCNGAYMEINGGTFRVYEGQTNIPASGSLIIAHKGREESIEVIINGGTFYGYQTSGAGSILNADSARTVTINGGTFYGAPAMTGSVLYTGGELTINGGEFHGVGTNYKTPSTNAHSHGGILTAYGEKLTINGGYFDGGAPSGYGPNIYYDRTANGGGELYIGKDAVIHGGVTLRGKSGVVSKVTVANGAVIDKSLTTTTSKPGYNLRVNFVELWVEGADAAAESWAGANNDDQKNFGLVYTDGVLTGFVAE